MTERHEVITDPPGRFGPKSHLQCRTCGQSTTSDLTGDELQRFAYSDTSWHRVTSE